MSILPRLETVEEYGFNIGELTEMQLWNLQDEIDVVTFILQSK